MAYSHVHKSHISCLVKGLRTLIITNSTCYQLFLLNLHRLNSKKSITAQKLFLKRLWMLCAWMCRLQGDLLLSKLWS